MKFRILLHLFLAFAGPCSGFVSLASEYQRWPGLLAFGVNGEMERCLSIVQFTACLNDGNSLGSEFLDGDLVSARKGNRHTVGVEGCVLVI